MQNTTKCNEVTTSNRMQTMHKLKYFNFLLPQQLYPTFRRKLLLF